MFITSKNKYLSNDMKIFGTCSIALITEPSCYMHTPVLIVSPMSSWACRPNCSQRQHISVGLHYSCAYIGRCLRSPPISLYMTHGPACSVVGLSHSPPTDSPKCTPKGTLFKIDHYTSLMSELLSPIEIVM